MNNRKFGVEIEFKGAQAAAVAATLKQFDLDCEVESYNHKSRHHWKVVPDSSVDGGYELVSPPIRGEEGFTALLKALVALRAVGARPDEQCGLHVHVDAEDLNGPTLAHLVGRYARHEIELDQLMTPSRRQSCNRFCKSLISLEETFCRTAPTDSAAAIARRMPERYYKLNLLAYERHGTVEYRHHHGTIEPEQILPWVRFCLNFVETSRVQVTRTVAPVQGYRKNAAELKYALLARLLDERAKLGRPVSVGEIANAVGCALSAVPVLISDFRRRYPAATLTTLRGKGYMRNTYQPLAELTGLPEPVVSYDAIYPEDQGPFAGLSTDDRQYFRARIAAALPD